MERRRKGSEAENRIIRTVMAKNKQAKEIKGHQKTKISWRIEEKGINVWKAWWENTEDAIEVETI